MESTTRLATAGVTRPFKLLLALVTAAILGGCGGGSDVADTPESVRSALSVQAQALVAVSPADAANQLMDFAEGRIPTFFPHGPTTGATGPFLFRFYPSSGIFLVVVVADGSPFLLNHVYVLGGPWAGPTDIGPLTNFITPVAPVVVPVPVNKNLSLSVNVTGVGSFGPFALGIVPLPTSQASFCSEAPSSTAFNQAFAQAGLSGTASITSCSFSGSTGTVGANVTANGFGTFPMTITFSYL